MRKSLSIFLLALYTLLVNPGFAQINTAEIAGTVTDAGGAVIVGATVTATNLATNAQRTATTNESGGYRIPALLPGEYSIRIETAGFRTHVQSDVVLQIAQTARIDTMLEVGEVTEVIEVRGGAPLLDTDSASLERWHKNIARSKPVRSYTRRC